MPTTHTIANKVVANKAYGPVGSRYLTPVEIKDRLDRFNAPRPYDWSIFDDIPRHHQADVMYPCYITAPKL